MLKKISEKINKSYENEKQSRDIVFSVLNILIMPASCIMTVVNIATREDGLAIATGLFALLCFLNYLLVKINILKLNISVAVFTVEAMLLLIFFIVSGILHSTFYILHSGMRSFDAHGYAVLTQDDKGKCVGRE